MQATFDKIRNIPGLTVYPLSLTETADGAVFLARSHSGKQIGVLAPRGSALLEVFSGDTADHGEQVLLLGPANHANAAALRKTLDWLRPRPLGLSTSAGCGDRLGLATPGHVRAARRVPGIAMIFAQQSIREMARTLRDPDEVMDDATWGVFQEGWQEGVGADADHLKTPNDIDHCHTAGFTFYTIDPGEHVDPAADTDDESMIRTRYEALPWGQLEMTPQALEAAYRGKEFDLGDRKLILDEQSLLRAAVKYGRAVAHVVRMYRHLLEVTGQAGSVRGDVSLAQGELPFELEVSVDETETPTSHAEHVFVAHEMRRLGVRWVSLAPRYVGRFEKGVDYIGDLAAFERDFAGHAAIARALGPYKLSLHSGSDKFSIYGIAARHAQGLIHLKTAGTSYLEALRAAAGFDPGLFREILEFSIERYETDRASYHVSADLSKVPEPAALGDGDLAGLLDQFDARQVLHVTFGSVLTSERGFKGRLLDGLVAHEEEHYAVLERHFVRHLAPLQQP